MDDETPLDPKQVHNVYQLYHSFPDIVSARNALTSMVLACPPHIELKGLGAMEDELRETLWTYWLPWEHHVFDWLHMLGVCPWRYERIEGTEDEWYPWVPPYHAGVITTFLDRRRKQQFRYYWNDVAPKSGKRKRATHDSRMNFVVFPGFEPNMRGELVSPMAALLPDYLHMLKLREAEQLVTERQLNPQNVLEFTPARNKTSDQDAIMTLQYGEDIAMQTVRDRERLTQAQYQVSRDEVNAALLDATYRNLGRKPSSVLHTGAGGLMYADVSNQKEWRARNASLFESTAILPPDYHYKPMQVPRIQAQLEVALKRLSDQAAKVMGYAESMMGSGGAKQRGMGAASLNLRFVNETVKRWSKFFARHFKLVFVFAYDKQLREERARGPLRFHPEELSNMDAVTVRTICTPITDMDQIQQLEERRFITRETSGKYQVALAGLDEEDFELLPPLPAEQPARARGGVLARETKKML